MASIDFEQRIEHISSKQRCLSFYNDQIVYHMDVELQRKHNTDKIELDHIPNLSKWEIPNTKWIGTAVEDATTQQLRTFWRAEDDKMKMSERVRPPMSIGTNFSRMVPKDIWRIFWKADIPHNGRTTWWSFVHNKIPHQERMHRIQPVKYTDTTCVICNNTSEDTFSFCGRLSAKVGNLA